MNLVLLFETDFIGDDRVRVADRRFEHIRRVIQPRPGETLRVGLLGGRMGDGEVLSLSDSAVELKVCLAEQPPAALPLQLLMALPRPKNLPRLLQTVTQMGVKDIHFFHSFQVEKSFWTSDYLSTETVEQACLLGLEQARDTVMPQVHFHRWFKPFVEDVVPGLCGNRKKLVAHPAAGEVCPAGLKEATALAIGPEGGLIEYEVEKLAEAGFLPVQIGPRILKVEVALTFLLGRLFR